MTETIDRMTDAWENLPAFENVENGACATSNVGQLLGLRDLQCLSNGLRPGAQILPCAELQPAIRIKSGWMFLPAEFLDRLRSVAQERTKTANNRVVFLRLEPRRLGLEIRASETLMNESESPPRTRMRKSACIALSYLLPVLEASVIDSVTARSKSETRCTAMARASRISFHETPNRTAHS